MLRHRKTARLINYILTAMPGYVDSIKFQSVISAARPCPRGEVHKCSVRDLAELKEENGDSGALISRVICQEVRS